MKNTLELQKLILSPDTRDLSALLESLDSKSRILAKIYLTALVDRMQFDTQSSKQPISKIPVA